MGNAGSMDSQQTDFRAHNLPLKLPMPEPGELEERFAVVLVSADRVGFASPPHPGPARRRQPKWRRKTGGFRRPFSLFFSPSLLFPAMRQAGSAGSEGEAVGFPHPVAIFRWAFILFSPRGGKGSEWFVGNRPVSAAADPLFEAEWGRWRASRESRCPPCEGMCERTREPANKCPAFSGTRLSSKRDGV